MLRFSIPLRAAAAAPRLPPTWPELLAALKALQERGVEKKLSIERMEHTRQFPGFNEAVTDAGMPLADADLTFLGNRLVARVTGMVRQPANFQARHRKKIKAGGPLPGYSRVEGTLQTLKALERRGLAPRLRENRELQGAIFVAAAATNHRVYDELRKMHLACVKKKRGVTFSTKTYHLGLMMHLLVNGQYDKAQTLADHSKVYANADVVLFAQRLPSSWNMATKLFDIYVEGFQYDPETAWTTPDHRSPEFVEAYCDSILTFTGVTATRVGLRVLWKKHLKGWWVAPENKYPYLRALGTTYDARLALQDHPRDEALRAHVLLCLARVLPVEGLAIEAWFKNEPGVEHLLCGTVFPFPSRPPCTSVAQFRALLDSELTAAMGDAAQEGTGAAVKRIVVPDHHVLNTFIDDPPPSDTLVLLPSTLLAHLYASNAVSWQLFIDLLNAGGMNAQVVYVGEEVLFHREVQALGVLPASLAQDSFVEWTESSLTESEKAKLEKSEIKTDRIKRVSARQIEKKHVRRAMFEVGFITHEIARPRGVAVELLTSAPFPDADDVVEPLDVVEGFHPAAPEAGTQPLPAKTEAGAFRYRFREMNEETLAEEGLSAMEQPGGLLGLAAMQRAMVESKRLKAAQKKEHEFEVAPGPAQPDGEGYFGGGEGGEFDAEEADLPDIEDDPDAYVELIS